MTGTVVEETPCKVILDAGAGSGLRAPEVADGDGTATPVEARGDSTVHVPDPGSCLRPQNPSAHVDDMTRLNHLHEPGVLHNIAQRYDSGFIYTYTGRVLLAVNPFEAVPGLYDRAITDQYAGAGAEALSGGLPPHIYGIAQDAFHAMCAGIERSLSGEATSVSGGVCTDQAILVSGESGAGKTETAKHIMSYLAYVGGRRHAGAVLSGDKGGESVKNGRDHREDLGCKIGETSGRVEAQVLGANPVLEAFGNAKTVRNANSSRFGKFVEIQFDRHARIAGAAVRTYLLERSRVASTSPGERNFHVFFYLCAGSSEEERAAFRLAGGAKECAWSYAYLGGGVHQAVDPSDAHVSWVEDATRFAQLKESMADVGFGGDEITGIFRVLAAILHLGNVSFVPDEDADDDRCALSPTSGAAEALNAFAALVGVDEDEAFSAIATKRLGGTRRDAVEKGLDVRAAERSRDTLARTMYARIFDFIVQRINASINCRSTQSSPAVADDLPSKMGEDGPSSSASGRLPHSEIAGTISILDIYGFECFEENSFEQLCINYANEKLQQHFNEYVLRGEQEAYERDGIDWRYIDFVDNQDLLDLIEQRRPNPGFLALLDEHCILPGATDFTFNDAIHKVLGSVENQRLTRPPTRREAFSLRHYAGVVTYNPEGFLVKNNDTHLAEHAVVLKGGAAFPFMQLVNEALKDTDAVAVAPAKPSTRRLSSVASKFKLQLELLMDSLEETQPHFIRCIKPNSQSVPRAFQHGSVLHQLRCGGILEVIRIACAGFPSRIPFSDLLRRFGPSLGSSVQTNGKGSLTRWPDEREAVAALLSALSSLPGERTRKSMQGWQLGHTRAFLKAGQLALLEVMRLRRITACVLCIQSTFRAWLQRRRFNRLRRAVICTQKRTRGCLARKKYRIALRERSALIIQRHWRGHAAVIRFVMTRKAVLCIQESFRGHRTRVLEKAEAVDRAATAIQARWRGHTARKEARGRVKAVVHAQNLVRTIMERRDLGRLRREAIERKKSSDEELAMKDSEISMLKVRLAHIEARESVIMKSWLEWSAAEALGTQEAMCALQGQLNAANGEIARLKAMVASLRASAIPPFCDAESPFHTPRRGYSNAPTTPEATSAALQELRRQKEDIDVQTQEIQALQLELEQERLLKVLKDDTEVWDGLPVAAIVIYRSLLEWRCFESDRVPLFSKIVATIEDVIEGVDSGENGGLVRALGLCATLHGLVHVCLVGGGPPKANNTPAEVPEYHEKPTGVGSNIRGSTSAWSIARVISGLITPEKKRFSSSVPEPSNTNEPRPSAHAKYTSMLFKQQLASLVERIDGVIYETVKFELLPLLALCFQPSRNQRDLGLVRTTSGGSALMMDAIEANPWNQMTHVFKRLVGHIQEACLPEALASALFSNVFAFVNVHIFNTLLLRRECCSLSHAFSLKHGLGVVEAWVDAQGMGWLQSVWEELRHTRQVVGFLVIHQKSRKSYAEIRYDLCPALTVSQLDRIANMYWDDQYETESVSPDVAEHLRRALAGAGDAGKSPAGGFLLEERPVYSLGAEPDALTACIGTLNLAGFAVVPVELLGVPHYAFLGDPM